MGWSVQRRTRRESADWSGIPSLHQEGATASVPRKQVNQDSTAHLRFLRYSLDKDFQLEGAHVLVVTT